MSNIAYTDARLDVLRECIKQGISHVMAHSAASVLPGRMLTLPGVYEKMRRLRVEMEAKEAAARNSRALIDNAIAEFSQQAPKLANLARTYLPPAPPEPVLPLKPRRPKGWDEGFSMLGGKVSERAGSAHGAAIVAAPSF